MYVLVFKHTLRLGFDPPFEKKTRMYVLQKYPFEREPHAIFSFRNVEV